MAGAGCEFRCEKMREIFQNSVGAERSHIVRKTRSVFLHLAGGWKLWRSHVEQRRTRIREPSYRLGLNETEKWALIVRWLWNPSLNPRVTQYSTPFFCGKYRRNVLQPMTHQWRSGGGEKKKNIQMVGSKSAVYDWPPLISCTHTQSRNTVNQAAS